MGQNPDNARDSSGAAASGFRAPPRSQPTTTGTDLARLTAEVSEFFRAGLAKNGIHLVVACDADVGETAVDRGIWETIVFHLVSNACKATRAGEVLVELRRAGEQIELSVRDTGAGLSEERQAELMRRDGGGLALVRRLVRKLGGAVTFDRQTIQGTRVNVAVPALPRAKEAGKPGTSEPRFEQLLDMLPVGVCTCDATGAVTFFNRRAVEIWGTKPDLNCGYADFAAHFKLFTLDGAPVSAANRPLLLALREGRTLQHGEMLVERPNGSRFVTSFSIGPTYDENGAVSGSINVFQDITEEKRARAALRATEERYRAIFEQASVGIFECDLGGTILRCNPALARIVGYDTAELVGMNWRDLVPADDVMKDEMMAEQLLRRKRGSFTAERRFRRRNGSDGWIDVFATLILNEAGQPAYGLAIVVDVTERKIAAAKLRETEERFQVAADNAPVLIWMTDEHKACTWCNQPWLDFVGKPLSVELSEGWLANVHPDDRARAASTFEMAFHARESFTMEYRMRRHDGEHRWVLSRSVPRYEGGQFAGYIGSCVDIEDRRRAEEAMHTSRNAERARRQEMEVITEVAPAGIWMAHDPECNLVTGNSAAHAMVRVPPGENLAQRTKGGGVRGVDIFSGGKRVPPEDLPLRKAIRTRAPVLNHDLEFRFPDGTSTWVYGSATPLFAEDGSVRGSVCIMVDVSERRQAEAALRQSEEQLRLVTDHASVFLARLDHQHRYRFVNRSYAERYGATPQEIVDKHVVEVAGREAYERAREQMDRALAGERVEFEMEIPVGSARRWGHVVFVPERTADGVITGLVVVLADITQRKQAETELERARDEAVAASRAKDDFLAALSHELRTPLSPVLLLASEAAADAELSPELRADFDTIRKSVELEARLIDDLLDLTRITRGKLVLDTRATELKQVVQDALATVRADFSSKKISVSVEFAPEPQIVWSDPVRLQQVFWNVLKNAVKFTPSGGRVQITSRVDHVRKGVVVEISDTGIGITAQELERVFEAFSQGDHAAAGGSHRFGGLGLGLAISRRVVELHGGVISARSAGRDHGATFCIELPLQVAVTEPIAKAPPSPPLEQGETKPEILAAKPPSAAPPRQAIGRILLVEDHAATRAALQHLLSRRHYEVRAAATAAEARQFAREAEFDLMVSDIGLPDGNGYELMKEFRDLYGLAGIALTGYGMEEDVNRSRNAGFVRHLTKPIRIQALDEALASAGTERVEPKR